MNEDHIIAAILAAGQIARAGKHQLDPGEAIEVYEQTLTALLSSNRAPREAEA